MQLRIPASIIPHTDMETPHYGFDIRWSEEDEAFLATCPSFTNLSAFGATPEHALREASVALKLFIAEYEADGQPLPPPHTAQPA